MTPLITDLGDDPKQTEGDERSREELVACAQRDDPGPAVSFPGGHDEPEAHNVVVHGTAAAPPRAAMGPGTDEPRDANALPVGRRREAEPARLGRVDDGPQRRAGVRGHRPRRHVHLLHARQPRRADEQRGAVPGPAAGAGELRDGVGEAADDLDAGAGGAGARHGGDHLLLGRRVRDGGHGAVGAVAGPRAVGVGEHAAGAGAAHRRARRQREHRRRGMGRQQQEEKGGEHFFFP